MHVRLETRDGGFVRDGIIPPFLLPPMVITWASRTFVFRPRPGSGFDTTVPESPAVYVEDLAYPLETADALVERLREAQ